MKKPKGFLGGSPDEAAGASVTQTAPADASNTPSTKTPSTAGAIVRPEPDALVRSAKGYASEARAHGTRKAYAKHWTAFAAWCDEQGFCALPAAPQTLALYLGARGSGTQGGDARTRDHSHLPGASSRGASVAALRTAGEGNVERHPPPRRLSRRTKSIRSARKIFAACSTSCLRVSSAFVIAR
jgi:hypothetical protein